MAKKEGPKPIPSKAKSVYEQFRSELLTPTPTAAAKPKSKPKKKETVEE